MKNKIRVLLFILTLLFIGTAISIKTAIKEPDILNLDTKSLISNLHKKEKIVDKLLEDSVMYKTIKNSQRYPLQVKEIANKYEKQSIQLYIYKDNKAIFWNSNIYVPDKEILLRNPVNFINTDNYGFLLKQKKLPDNYTLIAIIPLLRNYKYQNYEKENNKFLPFLEATNLTLAKLTDNEQIRNIYSLDNTYLFSVKLKEGKYDNIYLKIQLLCWGLATICFAIMMNSISLSLARRQKPLLSIVIFAFTFLLIRAIDIQTNWLAQYSSLAIFDSQNYAYNSFNPNLWSYLINSIMYLWLVSYCVYIRNYINLPQVLKGTKWGAFVYYLLLIILYTIFLLTTNQLVTLVTHSKLIEEEFINVFYTDNLLIVYVAIYLFNIIALIFIVDLIQYFGKILCPKINYNLNVQLITIIQFLIIGALTEEFSLVTYLLGALILIRSFDDSIFKKKNISTYVMSLVILALITTVKYTEAVKVAHQEQMKVTITTLQSNDDIQAITLFSNLEQEIQNDEQLKHLLTLALPRLDAEFIDEYIKRKYLVGYLSKYEYQGTYFNSTDLTSPYISDKINLFREKVINNSTKVAETNTFYRVHTSVGTYEYFTAINLELPIGQQVTLHMNFKNIAFNTDYPLAINNSNFETNNLYQPKTSSKSFAFYREGLLMTQNGNYTYPNTDNNYPKETNVFHYLEDDDNYFHVLYKPDANTSIIVSHAYQTYWQVIAIASICFLFLYISTAITRLIISISPKYWTLNFTWRELRYEFYRLFSKIRYSTRIQTLVILSVLIAIIISGLITFFSIRYQSFNNTQKERVDYISEIVSNLENKVINDTNDQQAKTIHQYLKQISSMLVTDFNLYDKNGKLIFSTQPKIYDQHLLSEYIDPDVFIDLNVLKKSASLNKGFIFDFTYDASYAPIHNSNYQIIAYLCIPYYNSKQLDIASINILINTILNVYTIILIVFAFLSLYISNKITEPLQLIRSKLSQTNLAGTPNEPLYWQKNDEIGLLVREYNYMLLKLEENAKQLRDVERESAWREMAKQVAHEIKNPLTPMKLGIQQLTRSFNENDPKLQERFAKISSSFIQQIDTLAHIASEFSAFAKLPDTKLVEINIMDKIQKSMNVYNNNEGTFITLTNHTPKETLMVLGDRDQLLRTFNNLFKNAIEAASNRKRKIIDVKIVPVGKDWIQIQVKDNGFGIPNEVIPSIFKPNFTTKSSGTGLGLAFVKQTIEGMGGKVSFKTKLNDGTIFFLDIPLLIAKNN